MILSTTACSSLFCKPQKIADNQDVKDLKGQVDEIRKEVPKKALEECKGVVGWDGITMEDLISVIAENTKRHKECIDLNTFKTEVIKDKLK